MTEDLYGYYERELIFIRQMAQEFARQYPAAAGRLLLEPNRSLDPHVERLIESFALLAGRVHRKLDDEFPELTSALLGVLYPHYLAPIPSMAIVQFELDFERARLPQGFLIERGARLQSPPVRDVACRFRTAYPVRLWPVAVASARYLAPPIPAELAAPPGTAAALRIRLESKSGLGFADLSLDRLRFYLNGEAQVSATLYEAIFNNTIRVAFRDPESGRSAWLDPSECLHPVGFDRDEGLLPYPAPSFAGYRLLTEFFAFPNKFLFADLSGFDRARETLAKKSLEVVLFLGRASPNLEQGIDAGTFRLGCSPVVNLFEQTAEPIAVTQAVHEYRVVPDVAIPDATEVYSIDQVVSTDTNSRATTEYHPYYALHHGSSREDRRNFWYASRSPSARQGDGGTDVTMSLVDLDFDPLRPADTMLVVRTTCTNRDLPSQLRRFGDRLSFRLEGAAPLSRIRCLRLPTSPVRPPSRRGSYWRLVSHLSLNHLSISDPVEGRHALQEILGLYAYLDPGSGEGSDSAVGRIIDGITSLESRQTVGWLDAHGGGGFCRGVEVTVELDEGSYVGTGAFLFASVLERFLGLYVAINSFSQLVLKIQSRPGILKRWPPRAGDQVLL